LSKRNNYICTKCKSNSEIERRNEIKKDEDKIILLYKEKHNCIKCNIELTTANWGKAEAIRRYYICRECQDIRLKTVKLKIKTDIINIYGGKCFCCGIEDLIFLTIDHIDESGANHRKGLKDPTGVGFYRWLRQQGYPKDNYQVLCFNCNFAKHVLGICPHATYKIS
jgi:hypothetical protein